MSDSVKTPAIIIFVVTCLVLVLLPAITLFKSFMPSLPNYVLNTGAVLQLIILGLLLMKTESMIQFIQLSLMFSSSNMKTEEFVKAKAKSQKK
jgi:hypothetical protein